MKKYKAAFDYKKIGEGFCAFVLVALSPSEYSDPERIATSLARQKEVESVGIVSGEWELVMKVRTRDQDEYFNVRKNVTSKEKGIGKTISLISLKEIKTEFIKT